MIFALSKWLPTIYGKYACEKNIVFSRAFGLFKKQNGHFCIKKSQSVQVFERKKGILHLKIGIVSLKNLSHKKIKSVHYISVSKLK